MTRTFDEIQKILNPIEDSLEKLPSYVINVGVFESETDRKKSSKGVTNAELMYIHENGSPLKHIPSRPVLEMSIRWANENLLDSAIDKSINKYFESDFEIKEVDKEIEVCGLKIQNYARKIIYSNDGRLTPNSPATIKRKGDNHPLFDTGQLTRSITYRVDKEKK